MPASVKIRNRRQLVYKSVTITSVYSLILQAIFHAINLQYSMSILLEEEVLMDFAFPMIRLTLCIVQMA